MDKPDEVSAMASRKPSRPKYGGKFVPHLTKRPLFKDRRQLESIVELNFVTSYEALSDISFNGSF